MRTSGLDLRNEITRLFLSKYPSQFDSLRLVHVFRRHISNVPQPRGWERKIAEGPPCVVLASPGFLQTGPSRELLELWAPDPRNGLIITGYSVEGTLARVSGSWDGTDFSCLACSSCIVSSKCHMLFSISMSDELQLIIDSMLSRIL